MKNAKMVNLKATVGREKAVQAIDVHRECKNCVVTFWVISQLLHFLGASRGCADFRDTTAVFRLNLKAAVGRKKDAEGIGVHGEIKNFVVTFWVMRYFFYCAKCAKSLRGLL